MQKLYEIVFYNQKNENFLFSLTILPVGNNKVII